MQGASPVHGRNQWPRQAPAFEAALQQYISGCLSIGQAVMRGRLQVVMRGMHHAIMRGRLQAIIRGSLQAVMRGRLQVVMEGGVQETRPSLKHTV